MRRLDFSVKIMPLVKYFEVLGCRVGFRTVFYFPLLVACIFSLMQSFKEVDRLNFDLVVID